MRKLLSIAVGVLVAFSAVFGYKTTKCTNKVVYAMFKDGFTEPIEIFYVLMNDMKIYKFTSNYESRILFSVDYVEDELQSRGHEISNILVMIHGHWKSGRFSPSDIRVWRSLKRKGFIGHFYMYLKRDDTIYELEEDDNRRKP